MRGERAKARAVGGARKVDEGIRPRDRTQDRRRAAGPASRRRREVETAPERGLVLEHEERARAEPPGLGHARGRPRQGVVPGQHHDVLPPLARRARCRAAPGRRREGSLRSRASRARRGARLRVVAPARTRGDDRSSGRRGVGERPGDRDDKLSRVIVRRAEPDGAEPPGEIEPSRHPHGRRSARPSGRADLGRSRRGPDGAVGGTPAARARSSHAAIFSGRCRRRPAPSPRTPLKYRNGPPSSIASRSVRLPVTMRSSASGEPTTPPRGVDRAGRDLDPVGREASRSTVAGCARRAGSAGSRRGEAVDHSRGDHLGARRARVPDPLPPPPSAGGAPSERPDRGQSGSGLDGFRDTRGRTRDRSERGEQVKDVRPVERAVPAERRSELVDLSRSPRAREARGQCAAWDASLAETARGSPPTEGRVRANSSRLTWRVDGGPYACSTARHSSSHGPPRPNGSGRLGAALTPHAGETVRAAGARGARRIRRSTGGHSHGPSTERGSGRPGRR